MRRWFCGMAIFAVALPTACLAVDLTGVVRDAQGEPLEGVRIDVASAAPKFGPGIFCPTCYLDCAKYSATDAEGRFEIAGLSPELKFRVMFTVPGKVAFHTELIDPRLESLSIQLQDAEQPPAERRIRGIVRGDDGELIEGALIYATGAKSSERTWWGRVDVSPASTDAAGRFELILPEEILGVSLQVTAAGFAGMETNLVEDLVEAGDHDVELVVPRGANVEGTLNRGGEPLPGAQIAVVQTDRSASGHFIKAVMAETDAAGRFAMRNLPADQEYAVFTPVGSGAQVSVVSTKRFHVPASGETRDLGVLEVRSGLHFSGRLETREGEILPSEVKMLLGRDPAWDLIEVSVDDSGRFEIAGLPPETYKVRIAGANQVIDADRLRYQQLDDRSFGVRLEASLDDVIVPIRTLALNPPATDPVGRAVAAVAPQAPESENVAVDKVTEAPTELVVTGLPIERTIEPVPADAPRLRVGGRVLDDAGRPVAGADVSLRAMIGGQVLTNGVHHNYDILATTTTNDEGWYYFDDVGVPLRMKRVYSAFVSRQTGIQIVVRANGMGVAWAGVDAFDNPGPLAIQMNREVEVLGTVRDHAGAPVAGAVLRAYGLTYDAWEGAQSYVSDPNALNLNVSQIELSATTDEEGCFRFHGLPRGCIASVGVKAVGYAHQAIWIDAWTGSASNRPSTVHVFQESNPMLRSPIDLSLEPTGVLRLRVIDAEGVPVPFGAVQVINEERRIGGREARRVDGLSYLNLQNEGELLLIFSGDPLRPQIGAMTTVQIENRLKNVDMELRLPPTRRLSGRVVDAGTGEGIAGVSLRYRQSLPNETTLHQASAYCVSDAAGDFQVPVLPGPGALWLHRQLQGFETQTDPRNPRPSWDFDVPETGEISPVTLSLSRESVVKIVELSGVDAQRNDRTIAGRVVDLSGNPLPGVRVTSRLRNGSFIPRRDRGAPPFMTTGADGSFLLGGLPNEAIELMAFIRRNPKGGRIRYPAKAIPEINQQDVVIILDPTLDEPEEILETP